MADDVPLVMSNSAVQPPRKQPPSRLSLHSRSLSRSSSRQYTHARDFDPILRNLSPTTTLRAFSEPGLLATNDILHTSLQNATYSQRTLGAKAAQTGLDVRSWARELEEWDWPGSFDLQESTRKISEDIDIAEENGSAPPYCGSLPAATVKEYEQRADEIVHQLDDIDVEELKDFVLSAHHEAGNGSASMDDSIGAIGAATDLRKLDDFTAIITATIMQALPYLSRLNRLLDTWTLRLAILRQAPYFLEGLEQAHADLEGAWRAIGVASATDADKEKSINFNRGHMIETQSIIEHKVSGLGRKLDRFLDDLEGRSETVPDTWIEKMETLEQQYAEWTVRAERKVLENELKKNRWSKIASPKSPQSPRRIQSNPVNKEETSARSEASAGRSLVDPPVSLPANNTIPNRTLAADTASPAGQVSSHALSTDREASSILELARDDSQTIPSDQADVIVDKGSVHSRTSSRRSRHVAIILPYDGGDGQEYPSEGITGDLVSRGGSSASQKQPGPVPAASSSDGAVSFAKKRAMFTGDLERTQSLQRATKSPVRPFEHASNAFARLFNKMETSTPERSRSSSRTEVERLRSASNKTENGIIWGGRPSSSAKQSPRRKTMDSGPRNIPKGQDKAIDNAPVAVEADAPPVPTLPPKSPRRSLQSPMKPAERNSATSTASPKQSKTLPFPDFDFGENWPLTPPEPASEHDSPVEAQIARFQAQTTDECEGPSLISPKKPLESDFFHRVFVEGMPNTPEHDRVPSPALPEDHHLAPAFDYAEPPQEQSSHSQSAVPTIHPSMLNRTPESVQQAHFVSREASITTPPMIQKPNHIDLPTNSSLPVPLQSADGPVTPNSVASDTYSPEIQDARVSYFQMTSPSLSRTTSAATTSPNHQRVLSSQTTSPTKMRNSSNGEGTNNDHEAMYDNLTRRASGMSLEVKTIDLTRRKSNSSAIESNVHTLVDEPSSPISRNEMSIFPTPPTIHEERPRSPVSPLVHSPGQHELRHRTSNLSVVSDHTSPAPEQAGLNAFMGKRRGMGLQSGNAPVNGRTKKKPEPDSFDRHVSEVIQRLPSAIRFRSGATTPQPGDSRSFSGPRPKLNPRVSSRMSENITLAPADPSPNRRSPAANEPEVKLYHLTQAGREEPIKLFVRLVGEGERVMVRVGGGWADLADYLRQYAEHHGSRTVSGEVDVKAFSSPITAGGNGGIHPALRRKASGPLSNELYRTKSNTPSPDTPVHDIAEHPEKENSDSSGLLSTSTPTRPPVVPPRSPSRPSTSDSNRPGSKHSWAGSSISGTGGSGKKFDDLSEDKKRWVEGMIDRVQTAGADKKGEAQQKQKFFGEMGTVGGTRRVVFNRSASGADMGRN